MFRAALGTKTVRPGGARGLSRIIRRPIRKRANTAPLSSAFTITSSLFQSLSERPPRQWSCLGVLDVRVFHSARSGSGGLWAALRRRRACALATDLRKGRPPLNCKCSPWLDLLPLLNLGSLPVWPFVWCRAIAGGLHSPVITVTKTDLCYSVC